jgi:hypothetical protein
LGAKTDRIMSAKDQEFLPDNLMNALDASNQPVVLEKNNLLPAQPIASDSNNTSPIQLTTRLLFIAFILGLIKNKYSQRGMIIFDKFFFTVVGLLGILLVFMWIGTDHSMTKNNYNLAWALPSFIAIPWIMKKQTPSAFSFIAFHRYILAFMLLRVLSINSPFIAGFLVSTMEFSFIISTHNAVLSIILLILICIFYKFNFSVYFFALGWISSILLRYGLIHYYQDNLYLAKSIIVLIPFFLFLISIKKQEGSTIVKHRGD